MDPRAEQDRLFLATMEAAKKALEEHGEFWPAGAVILKNGKVRPTGAYTGKGFPEPAELEAALVLGMQQERAEGLIRGAAICTDITIHREGEADVDAIRVRIEHEDTRPVEVFCPYQPTGEADPRYHFGELQKSLSDALIFA